ncbi:hypothetical protein QQM79_15560 [Marinobacteraceae bacterium S3BR75-40.1]
MSIHTHHATPEHPLRHVNWVADIKPPHGEPQEVEVIGVTDNGLQIAIETTLPIGTCILMRVHGFLDEPIEFYCKAEVRLTFLRHDEFVHSLHFVEIDPAISKKLDHFTHSVHD